LSKDLEDKFIKPIVNACYPATLAALNLTVLQFTGPDSPQVIRILIALGSIMFLLSSFSIFFYTIYPTKRKLWTTAATSFLQGLASSLIAVIVILAL